MVLFSTDTERAKRIQAYERWANVQHVPVPGVEQAVVPYMDKVGNDVDPAVVDREVQNIRALLRLSTEGRVGTDYHSKEFSEAVKSQLTPEELLRVDFNFR